jgi:hypothetical protein
VWPRSVGAVWSLVASFALRMPLRALLSQRVNDDTSPRLGCCKVAGGSCGGNFFKAWRLSAKWLAHGYWRSNLPMPLGEPVESAE